MIFRAEVDGVQREYVFPNMPTYRVDAHIFPRVPRYPSSEESSELEGTKIEQTVYAHADGVVAPGQTPVRISAKEKV